MGWGRIQKWGMCYWNFSCGRVAILLLLLIPFCLWAGTEVLIYGVPRGWGYRHSHPGLLFLGGAVMATVVDLWVGNLDRKNWRLGLIVVGVLMMGMSVLRVASV